MFGGMLVGISSVTSRRESGWIMCRLVHSSISSGRPGAAGAATADIRTSASRLGASIGWIQMHRLLGKEGRILAQHFVDPEARGARGTITGQPSRKIGIGEDGVHRG